MVAAQLLDTLLEVTIIGDEIVVGADFGGGSLLDTATELSHISIELTKHEYSQTVLKGGHTMALM